MKRKILYLGCLLTVLGINIFYVEYQVFIMFYSEGKTVKEIAKILNFSESKVKVVLHRVRKKIKTNLEDGGYSYGK